MEASKRAYHRELGRRLARMRKQQELTQAELAAILGVSQQTVFAYELGDRRVSLDRLPALLRLFGVTCDELLGLRPIQPPRARRVSPAERRLIEHVRELTAGDRRVVKRLAEALRRL
jgi:transcriptional regulator with XRE-family HTH domain